MRIVPDAKLWQNAGGAGADSQANEKKYDRQEWWFIMGLPIVYDDDVGLNRKSVERSSIDCTLCQASPLRDSERNLDRLVTSTGSVASTSSATGNKINDIKLVQRPERDLETEKKICVKNGILCQEWDSVPEMEFSASEPRRYKGMSGLQSDPLFRCFKRTYSGNSVAINGTNGRFR